MAIQFICPSCGRPIEVDDELANELVTCPFCRETANAPAESNLTGQHGLDGFPAVESRPMPAAASGPPPATNTFAWIAFGSVIVSAVCFIVIMVLQGWVASQVGPIDKPEELQLRVSEWLKGQPGMMVTLGLLAVGLFVTALGGLVFGILALVKKTPPRWPAWIGVFFPAGLLFLFCILSAIAAGKR